MNVAICCLNSKYIHASLAPWCLFSSVKENCKDITPLVFESTINNDINVLIEKVLNSDSHIVAFCCYIWNIEKTLKIAEIIKNKTNATVILGGPEVSYRAELILNEYDFVDFVITGEGEIPFPSLLNALKGNDDFTNISGLTYKYNGKILSNSEVFSKDTPESPYSDEFFKNLNGRISYIETSRGCPYNCAFCLSGRCAPLRFFDIEKAKEDIIKLSNSGTQTVKFVDRTFNANEKRANEIIAFIIKKRRINEIPENVCFHFEIAGDILKTAL